MAGLVVLGLVAIVAVAVAAGRQSVERQRTQLALLAKELGAPPPGTDRIVRGKRDGHSIDYALSTRGSGKSARPWTEVKTAIPPGLRFSLELRAETSRERGLRDRGLAVDVVVGDPLFDEAFIVEGAPAEVVRELLTPELRRELLALRPVEAKTIEGTIVVAKPGHILDLVPARLLADVTVALGRVRDASVAAEAALETQTPLVGDPYRAEPDAAAARAARDARDEELATLERVRGERKRHEQSIGLVIIAVIVVSILVFATLRASVR